MFSANRTPKNVKVIMDQASGDSIFTVLQDNNFVCDLVKEEGIWMEPFHGATSKSKMYGAYIEKSFDHSSVSCPANESTAALLAINL